MSQPESQAISSDLTKSEQSVENGPGLEHPAGWLQHEVSIHRIRVNQTCPEVFEDNKIKTCSNFKG